MTRRTLLALPSAALAQAAPDRKAVIAAYEKKLAGQPEKFDRREHSEIEGWRMPYRLFRPQAKGKLPLMLYLHGSGGLGSDNNKQITGGNLFGANLWTLPEVQKLQPCFVVAPQTDRGWIRYSSRRPAVNPPRDQRPVPVAGIGQGAHAAIDLVRSLIAEFNLDDKRIYISGQSMGGGGTWHLIAYFGEMFAAAAPYCGGFTAEIGDENPQLPVWNFHGTADETVDIQISRDRIAARKQAGGLPKHMEFEGAGHLIAPYACTEPNLPEWLFSQNL